jgi:signal transduction histidine kinase
MTDVAAVSLAERYERLCREPSDIDENLPQFVELVRCSGKNRWWSRPRSRRLAWRLSRLGHRGRATATFAIAAAAASTLLALLAYSTSRGYLTEQRQRAAVRRAYIDARTVRDALGASHADPGGVLSGLGLEPGAAGLVRVGGTWFSSSVAVESEELPTEVLAAVDDDAAAWQRYDRRGRTRLAIAVPLPAVDAVYATVVPLDELDNTLATLARSLLGAAIATTVVGGLLGFVAAGRLVRPLRTLAARAEAIASGSLDALDDIDDPEVERLARSLNQLLESHAQKAQIGSRFVSDVSHEVRAPLAALSAAVAVMERRRDQLPDKSALALDLLAEQVADFQALVVDLLEISRIDAGRAEPNLEPTDPVVLVRHVLANVGEDVPVVAAVGVPSSALLDRRRVGRALANLVENARLYAGGATRIAIRRHDGMLVFDVEDRGPGVPIAERARIFGRFERGEHGTRGPSGSGLGLALVDEHARLLGGGVEIVDNAEVGSIFRFQVRCSEPV